MDIARTPPFARRALAAALAALAAACVSVPPPVSPPPRPADAPAAVRGTLVVAGRPFPVDAPLVRWNQPGGYDATSTRPAFPERLGDAEPLRGLRYQPGRVPKVEVDAGAPVVPPGSTDLELLRSVVSQFVLHYDVCGTSRRCFEVLHDRRGLSVQFLLDVDGTLYQTLDARDMAWHAAEANYRSVGVEIANWGAYPPAEADELERRYGRDERGPFQRLPGDSGVRTPGFVPRPARPELARGHVHGRELVQYDLTPEQYDSLVALTVALCRAFPRIAPDAPRDAAGRVRTDALTPEEWAAFEGILGHWHVTSRKVDPGPAFDWEGFLARVRAELAADRPQS